MLMSRTNSGWPVHTPGAKSGGGRRGAGVSGARGPTQSEAPCAHPAARGWRSGSRCPAESRGAGPARADAASGGRCGGLRAARRRPGAIDWTARAGRRSAARRVPRRVPRRAHLFPLAKAKILRGDGRQHAGGRRARRLRARKPLRARLCLLQLGAVRAGGQLLRLARPGLLSSVLAARQRVHVYSVGSGGGEWAKLRLFFAGGAPPSDVAL